ncbi:hypothetical protein BDV98DRAFT_406375 [Pterulicium gracile]|uniref:Uncharacterized protein n=1 Tax=Pterulicium gracile TaxID=1884261 RepID=A0A5C3QMT2_9AGAR|nr:hypothetical protein BDV98DRAFT_406375 [Pterula gracilis]
MIAVRRFSGPHDVCTLTYKLENPCPPNMKVLNKCHFCEVFSHCANRTRIVISAKTEQCDLFLCSALSSYRFSKLPKDLCLFVSRRSCTVPLTTGDGVRGERWSWAAQSAQSTGTGCPTEHSVAAKNPRSLHPHDSV